MSIEIGKRMLERRKQLGISAAELADELKMSKATIHRYENGGIRNIKLPVIESIAACLSVDPAWLIGKTDQMHQGNDRRYSSVRNLLVEVCEWLDESEGLLYRSEPILDHDRKLLAVVLGTFMESMDAKYR